MKKTWGIILIPIIIPLLIVLIAVLLIMRLYNFSQAYCIYFVSFEAVVIHESVLCFMNPVYN